EVRRIAVVAGFTGRDDAVTAGGRGTVDVAAVAIHWIAVVAFLRRLGHAVTAGFQKAGGAATVVVTGIAVIALLDACVVDDSITAGFEQAVFIAAVPSDSVSIVAIFAEIGGPGPASTDSIHAGHGGIVGRSQVGRRGTLHARHPIDLAKSRDIAGDSERSTGPKRQGGQCTSIANGRPRSGSRIVGASESPSGNGGNI